MINWFGADSVSRPPGTLLLLRQAKAPQDVLVGTVARMRVVALEDFLLPCADCWRNGIEQDLSFILDALTHPVGDECEENRLIQAIVPGQMEARDRRHKFLGNVTNHGCLAGSLGFTTIVEEYDFHINEAGGWDLCAIG
ncbi:hypothetical protein [Aromatoleum bremense]|uniref:Uncharacterized protein n=1 Tax=Aromatoleum bremense TaxID=76115 RepID=A0ABX1NWH8_9RHOO|nr:hypothetical protein [Aromatoleum bremense]NMG15991.1 hypothetical protein [Aromatoleum bremense]